MRQLWIMGGLFGMTLLLAACGDVGGSGQCGGASDSGLCVTIDSITPTDTINGGDTPDVDAVQDDCGGELELWGAHAAKVALSAVLLSGVTSPPAADFVTFNQYAIQFSSSNAGPSGPAIASFSGPAPGTMKVTTGGTQLIVTLEMINVDKKLTYQADVAAASGDINLPASYTATFTFTGKDEFDRAVTVTGSTPFTMADYNHCS